MDARVRVLVADDDLELLDVVAEVIAETGASIVKAHDGAELARQLRDAGHFDLVVTDVALPLRSGLDVTAELRRAGSKMPILVMTAQSGAAVARQVGALGEGVAFLKKPFSLEELSAMVARLLARRAATRL